MSGTSDIRLTDPRLVGGRRTNPLHAQRIDFEGRESRNRITENSSSKSGKSSDNINSLGEDAAVQEERSEKVSSLFSGSKSQGDDNIIQGYIDNGDGGTDSEAEYLPRHRFKSVRGFEDSTDETKDPADMIANENRKFFRKTLIR